MTVIAEPYSPGFAETWDEFVRESRSPHFLFERAYMDYHADRFTDVSLVIREDDRIIAIFPASAHGDIVVSHGGLTFGGLISGHSLTLERGRAALHAILEHLQRHATRTLIYKAVPHIYHRGAAEEDLVVLHELGATLQRRHVSAAVAPGARPRQSSGRRYAIRQGEQAGFRVEESDQIEAFMEILADVLGARHDASPVHSAAEMRLLADRFPGRIRLWTATDGSDIASGYLVYETPTVAHVQYIATTADGRERGAGDVVAQHLLSNVYPSRWFDFGISNERDGTVNVGLVKNKEGFGARAIAYDHYALTL